ncbi:hypothetical protein HOP50_02g15340 [Chloropicon primus]|uniref:Radial spoke head protein 9 homolog n=1 Tax=Chloropicon primus TaxID=1764295 RepID=A0A5B8MH43_9CHLO|nr:hypothetical protein A3770_02p15430 [Chloropicon primus]UPQ98234.1 hypothetical protein HOP50_02g15340 [Chloropicon primus]|eukprot:QDZ19025.1 hypothetical protein A3770_02p15430 [Chloropicon primus]
MENNLSLTLDALASSGIVLSNEQKSAFTVSIPLKKAEAALKSLSLFGKIAASNGKDYFIAEGKGKAYYFDNKLVAETKFFYTQDCVKWLDLNPVDEETSKRCLTINTTMSGDPSQVYTVTEPAPKAEGAAEAAAEEGAEPAAEEAEEPAEVSFEYTELQRLQTMIQDIKKDSSIAPKGAYITTGDNDLILNKAFAGLEYPEKLESYVLAGESKTLADGLPGSWSLHYDSFSSTAVVRNLLWPGHAFYYSGETNSWGSLYFGAGMKNTEFIFMR